MLGGVINEEHRRLLLGGLTAISSRNSGTRRKLIMRRASQPGGRLPEQLRDMLARVGHCEWGN